MSNKEGKRPLFFSVWLSKNFRLLKAIEKSAQKKKVKLYLVGGALRDILLKREKENPDIDFCLEEGAINFSKQLAKELKAGFVVLDKEHGSARVVKKTKDKIYTLDFTDFRGRTLKDDLFHRDFTINTLAIELGRIYEEKDLDELIVDHYRGKKDLRKGLIRALGRGSFKEDPLRILRAFSLAALFDFKIHKDTLRLVSLEKNKISGVSGERVRDEFFKILSSPRAYKSFLGLDKYKILELIIPEIKVMHRLRQGPYHHLDVWGHSLETVRHLELIIRDFSRNKEMRAYLNEEISSGHKRYELIKLAGLLHDVGKPKALRVEKGKISFRAHERIGYHMIEDIALRFKLSNDEIHTLKQMILFHLRPGFLADNERITPRAEFRYFRDAAKEAVSILLISLADQRATKGPLTSKQSRTRHEKAVGYLIKKYFKKEKSVRPSRLINGDDLIRQFKLEPSPLIGKILSELEELQAIGKIKSKEEALSAAEKLIARNAKK